MKRDEIRRRYKDPVCGIMISRSSPVIEWVFGGKQHPTQQLVWTRIHPRRIVSS